MQTLRLSKGLAAGLLAATVLVTSALDRGPAYAQQFSEARTKSKKKTPPKETTERKPFDVQDQNAAVIPGIPDARAWGDNLTDFARLLPQAAGPWLAVSGGGSDGAYGAGLLVGWSHSGKRPEFAVATGVSIGSLIAPYAFLGSRYDDDLRKNFTTISAADIFEDRVTPDSLFDYWPLRRTIEERVTAKMLADVAAEHRRGRRLLVATTNLDAGRRVVWNMGAIAESGGERALKLFRDVLLASCAIPGFFSPVAIEVEGNGKKFQELHGDGTLTAPFFVVPEAMFSPAAKVRPSISELYVIINSKFESDFKMTDRMVAGVLGRSIDLALTSALRAQSMLLATAAQRHGIGLRIAYLPASIDLQSRGPFDGRYMKALFEVGIEQGLSGAAFADTLPDLQVRKSNSAQ